MKEVIVVGSLNVDITVNVPSFPVAGQSVMGTSLIMGMGGKGSNQATAAHRVGGHVRMIGRIGRDAMADVVRNHYAHEGMSMEGISESDTASTGTACIEVDASGQNRIAVVAGANEELSAAQVQQNEALFAGAGAVLTQLETGLAPVYAAKALAVQYGVPFLLNPAPYRPMPADLLAGVDWLTPNETEASAMTGLSVTDGESAAAAARAIQAMGVKNVLITLGGKGVYALWQGGEELLAPPAVKAVDTTGAGDAFNGAFASALADGYDVPTALRFASCCASLSVTRAGAAASMPQRPDTLALLQSTYGVRLG